MAEEVKPGSNPDEGYVYNKEEIDKAIAKFREDDKGSKKMKKKEKKQEDEDYNYDYGEKKKSSFGKYFLIGFVVLVVLVGIALCLYFFVFNKDEDNTIKNVKVNNDNLGAITMVVSEESNSLTATAHTKGNATFLGWAKDGLYGSIVVSEDVNLTISLDDESNYYALFNLTIDTTVYRNIQYTLYEEAHLAVATGVEDFSDETLEIPQVIMDSNANYQVYKIAGGAFANLDSVQSVRLNDKIIYIADNAFSGCDNITSVFVPSTNLYYEVVDGDLVDKNGNVLIDTPSVEEGEATESLLTAQEQIVLGFKLNYISVVFSRDIFYFKYYVFFILSIKIIEKTLDFCVAI